MGAAAVIAVLVAAGELSSPVTTALRLAAQQSLGPAAAVHVLAAPEPAAVDPIAVEEIAGCAHRRGRGLARARALARRAAGSRFWRRPMDGSRDQLFPADSLAERGRTLGLAISSAAPALARPHPSANTTAGPGPVATADETAPADHRVAAGSSRCETGCRARCFERRGTGLGQQSSPSDARDMSVAAQADNTRAQAVASAPIPRARRDGRRRSRSGGSDSSAGAAVEAALPIGGTVGLHFAGEMRTGPVAALSGTESIALAGGGLEWWPAVGRRTGLGLARI